MLSSFSYNFISNIANLKFFCIFVISTIKSFISQNKKVVGPLGGKFDFFSPSGFEILSDFDYRISKIKFDSVRALNYYLDEKNLIHDQVTATVSNFSPQMFEAYFDAKFCPSFQTCAFYVFVLCNSQLQLGTSPRASFYSIYSLFSNCNLHVDVFYIQCREFATEVTNAILCQICIHQTSRKINFFQRFLNKSGTMAFRKDRLDSGKQSEKVESPYCGSRLILNNSPRPLLGPSLYF